MIVELLLDIPESEIHELVQWIKDKDRTYGNGTLPHGMKSILRQLECYIE